MPRQICKLGLGVAAFLALMATGPALAEKQKSEQAPVEAFGNLPFISDIQIAPDGKHLAIVRRFEDRNVAMVMPRGVEGEIAAYDLENGFIRNFFWVNSERAIAVVTTTRKVRGYGNREITLRRLYSVAADGSDSSMIMREVTGTNANTVTAQSHSLLSPNLYKGREVLISAWSGWSQDVYRGWLDRGAAKSFLGGRGHNTVGGSAEWTTLRWMVSPDHESWVRWNRSGRGGIPTTMIEGKVGDADWQEIETYPSALGGSLAVLGFSEDHNKLYVTASRLDGPVALHEYDLSTGTLGKQLYAHESQPITGAEIDWHTGRLIAATYTDDEPRQHMLDPAYKKLQRLIDNSFPTTSVNRVISSTSDGTVHIISSSGPNAPELFYILDTENKTANYLGAAYPDLLPIDMAPVKPVTYQARDGLSIRAYLTVPFGAQAKNLPTVILPHGGPHARDLMVFDYMAQFLANRGYAVLQPNYRGSTGYGIDFELAGYGEWGGKMQDDVTDGVNYLIEAGIADPERVCIMGGSYGGYAALMGGVKTPDLYRCIISINGVSDLPDLLYDKKRTTGADFWAQSIGTMRNDGDKLEAASPARHAERFKAPVLLIHGEDDQTVPYDHSQKMERALKRAKKPVKLVSLDGDDHFMSKGDTRIAALKAVEAFLKKHLKH